MIDIVRKYLILLGLAILVVMVLSHLPSNGADFPSLYPAGRAVWNLENPYRAAPSFYNPPWFLLLLAPISLFEFQTARSIWFATALICYVIAFRRLGFSAVTILILLLSPFVYYDLGIGNYEWLILLGASLPPAIGSWFITLKPQASLLLLWLWFRQRHWAILIPVVLLAVLFILQIYTLPKRSDMYWSADIWPHGIPIGIILALLAIKRNDKLLALAAMPFLSPYVGMQTWIMALLPLTRNKFALIAGVLFGWFYLFLFEAVRFSK